MAKFLFYFFGGFLGFAASCVGQVTYQPTWESLDARPLPHWYDNDKIGIFVHWGVYAVPSFGTRLPVGAAGEWFWWAIDGHDDVDPIPAYVNFLTATEVPGFQYPEYAPRLTGHFFNASEWTDLFAAAGARYVVLTTKHHEGYCMWPSPTSFNWNSMDVGPHRDVVGELSAALRSRSLRFGAYHTLFAWFDPLYLADKAVNFTTSSFVEQKVLPELHQLVSSYSPDLIWSDGDWEASDSYWQSREFLAWLATNSSVRDTVVWNDRWGGGAMCHHGSFFTCADRFLPSQLVGHKWENAFTLDLYSWGYRRNMKLDDVMTTTAVVHTIVQTVALGGNALVNVGATLDGRIPAIFQDRLRGMGAWLAVNGEAVYGSTPWRVQNDSSAAVWYTAGSDAVFAIVTAWPTSPDLRLVAPIPTTATLVSMVGVAGPLVWQPLQGLGQPGLSVSLPSLTPAQVPCDHAWVLRLQAIL